MGGYLEVLVHISRYGGILRGIGVNQGVWVTIFPLGEIPS